MTKNSYICGVFECLKNEAKSEAKIKIKMVKGIPDIYKLFLATALHTSPAPANFTAEANPARNKRRILYGMGRIRFQFDSLKTAIARLKYQ